MWNFFSRATKRGRREETRAGLKLSTELKLSANFLLNELEEKNSPRTRIFFLSLINNCQVELFVKIWK